MSYIRMGTWVTFSSLQKLDHFMGDNREEKVELQERKKKKKKWVRLLKVEQAMITIGVRDVRLSRMVQQVNGMKCSGMQRSYFAIARRK